MLCDENHPINVALKAAYMGGDRSLSSFHLAYVTELDSLICSDEEHSRLYNVHANIVRDRQAMLRRSEESDIFVPLFQGLQGEMKVLGLCEWEDYEISSRQKSFASFEAKARQDLLNMPHGLSEAEMLELGQDVLNDTFGFCFVLRQYQGKTSEEYLQCILRIIKKRILAFFNKQGILLVDAHNFIKTPKPNGYQSRHLIFMIPGMSDSSPIRFEMQLRTQKMHFEAERGHSANHEDYKRMSPDYQFLQTFCKKNRMNELLASRFILETPFSF